MTDANLVLGYLDPVNFLGGKESLDAAQAEDALKRHIGRPLGFSAVEAAYGVSKVVSTSIARESG